MTQRILIFLFLSLLFVNCFDAGQKIKFGKKFQFNLRKDDFIPIFMDDKIPLKQAEYVLAAINNINKIIGRQIFGRPIYWNGKPPKEAYVNTIFVRMKTRTREEIFNNRITFQTILIFFKETGKITSADIFMDLAIKDSELFVMMLEHEFLHCLGLAHDTNLMCSKMHPTLSNCYKGNVRITNHDVKLLRKLYVK